MYIGHFWVLLLLQCKENEKVVLKNAFSFRYTLFTFKYVCVGTFGVCAFLEIIGMNSQIIYNITPYLHSLAVLAGLHSSAPKYTWKWCRGRLWEESCFLANFSPIALELYFQYISKYCIMWGKGEFIQPLIFSLFSPIISWWKLCGTQRIRSICPSCRIPQIWLAAFWSLLRMLLLINRPIFLRSFIWLFHTKHVVGNCNNELLMRVK